MKNEVRALLTARYLTIKLRRIQEFYLLFYNEFQTHGLSTVDCKKTVIVTEASIKRSLVSQLAGHRYCSFCGEPISQRTFESNSINAGNNNINIGLGNNSKQEIYIDNFNVTNPIDELYVEYSNRLDRKIIGGVNGFKRKFEITGILSAVSAVVTIIDYLVTKSTYALFLLMGTLALISYAIDSRKKYKELRKNRIVYRENKPILVQEENGDVFKVSKYGICPICGGRVYIYHDERFKKKLGKCKNNSDHLYTYDHTIDAGVPYMTFDVYHSK